MDLSPGYNLPPSVQERLRLLDWIAENGGTSPGILLDLKPLFEELEQPAALAMAANLQALESEGLIQLQMTLGWEGWSCNVTTRGMDLIERLRADRGNLPGRRKASRDAFLRWLYDRNVHGDVSPVISEFVKTDFGKYLGHEFTNEEVNAASLWLEKEGYLAGDGAFGGGIPRPTITTKGERIVESGRSVNDDSPVAASAPSHITNVNVSGTGHNVATHSPGAVQTTTVTMSEDNRQQVLRVAETLEGLHRAGLLGLDEPTSAEAVQVVSELRRAAGEPAVQGGVLRQLLNRAGAVAVAGTGAEMGHGVVALVHQGLQALGLA